MAWERMTGSRGGRARNTGGMTNGVACRQRVLALLVVASAAAVALVAAVAASGDGERAGRGRGEPAGAVVPDVSGQSVEFAEQTLLAAGLRAERRPPDTESLDFGPLVSATEPGTGSRVARGSVVALQTVEPLALPSTAASWLVPFDRVRVVDENTIQVRILVPGRCCRLEATASQAVGSVVRVLVSTRLGGNAIRFTRRRRWLTVELPEPLAGRPVLPAVGQFARTLPTRATWPARHEAPIVMPDDRTLVVPYSSGVPACYALNRVVVRERVDRVTLSVRVGPPRHAPANQACIRPGIAALAVVRLPHPVAGRDLRGAGR